MNPPTTSADDIRVALRKQGFSPVAVRHLLEGWNYSQAAFGARCTSMLQAMQSDDPRAQALKAMLIDATADSSELRQRDARRVAELVSLLGATPRPVAIVCSDIDTRHWLVGQLRRKLQLSPYPDRTRSFAISADPDSAWAGSIVVVAPDNALLQTYPHHVRFPMPDSMKA